MLHIVMKVWNFCSKHCCLWFHSTGGVRSIMMWWFIVATTNGIKQCIALKTLNLFLCHLRFSESINFGGLWTSLFLSTLTFCFIQTHTYLNYLERARAFFLQIHFRKSHWTEECMGLCRVFNG